MTKEWKDMTWQEKREERFKRWLSPPNAKFISPEAEKAYKKRVTRFIKAIRMETPDRVPCMFPAGFYPVYYAGLTLKKAMYDAEALCAAWLKFMHDFPDMDTFTGPGIVQPGKVLDMIDFKLYQWPGHGVGDDVSAFQFVEREYMKADEYDKLIHDPSDFWLRSFMPRQAGAFAGLAKLAPLTPWIGIPNYYLIRFANPEVQNTLKAMMAAGEELMKWLGTTGKVSRAVLEAGYPQMSGGFSGPPYDELTDMCRGTKGILLDIYRQPEKMHEAMESLIHITVEDAVNMANMSGCPLVNMPLHKGSKYFMSDKQFREFYWPTFKKVMMGMIEEGVVPMPFAEGNYEPRLEYFREMPKGSVLWYFEQVDLANAKRILGDVACIAGGLPVSVLCTGTPKDVKDYCRKAIEIGGPGGGYILASGANMDKRGNPDNLRAMIEAVNEYGVYR